MPTSEHTLNTIKKRTSMGESALFVAKSFKRAWTFNGCGGVETCLLFRISLLFKISTDGQSMSR